MTDKQPQHGPGVGSWPAEARPRVRRATATAMVVCIAMTAVLSGCAVVGPRAISNGRLTYSESIAETNNQQILLAVVRNRYAQASAMLAVSSVTANVKVSASTGFQVGIGDSDNYTGNLVPFSASGAYEENPTISYTPVSGSEYVRGFTAPFSVSTVAQLTSTMIDPGVVYYTLVAELNGLRNPDFLFPGVEADPRFDRAVEILVRLHQSRALRWVSDPGSAQEILIAIRPAPEPLAAEVDELMDLLGLPRPAPSAAGQTLTIPVSLNVDGLVDHSGELRVTTRSVYRLLEVLSAAVEVPEQDGHEGVAIEFPPLGRLGEQLHIRYSSKRPDRASLAVPFRDGWFFIDERDRTTKVFFRIVETLWSAVLADNAAKGPSGPVLTVPVSG